MWPFKRKKSNELNSRSRPFGELCSGDVVVRVWLNGQFPRRGKSIFKWGFSLGRRSRGRLVNSFRQQDLMACRQALDLIRLHLQQEGDSPTKMRELLAIPESRVRKAG